MDIHHIHPATTLPLFGERACAVKILAVKAGASAPFP
jgi:hypothetical protein